MFYTVSLRELKFKLFENIDAFLIDCVADVLFYAPPSTGESATDTPDISSQLFPSHCKSNPYKIRFETERHKL